MLSLIPAVLILILHGPAGVERIAVDGRLGEALRVLAARQTVRDESLGEALSERTRNQLNSLLSLGQDSPELSRFIAQVLQIAANLNAPNNQPSAYEGDPAKSIEPECHPSGSTCDGYLACRRSRDGPLCA